MRNNFTALPNNGEFVVCIEFPHFFVIFLQPEYLQEGILTSIKLTTN